jgi:uncharacterized membrane protein
MEISSGFLIVGLLMALVGAILIYKSLRASPHELTEDNDGVRYIGPIPIIVNGGRKWILAAVMITAVIIIYLVTKSMYPELLGGVSVG